MAENYPSPTTPGLEVSFKNLIVELVCLNMESKLPRRFWLNRKYWGPKYGREVRGFQKFSRLHENLEDPVMQRAIIEAVRETRCMTLLNEQNLSRLDRCVKRKYAELVTQREKLAAQATAPIPADEYMRRNTRLANLGGKSQLQRILEIEREQEKDAAQR